MKLWQIVQWGNHQEGTDGQDGQILISAVDMQTAIDKASIAFGYHNDGFDWKDGTPDVAISLGYDDRPDGEAVQLSPVLIGYAFNLGLNPAWHRHPTLGWMTQQEMYGEDI
jgi:hypothetical protein